MLVIEFEKTSTRLPIVEIQCIEKYTYKGYLIGVSPNKIEIFQSLGLTSVQVKAVTKISVVDPGALMHYNLINDLKNLPNAVVREEQIG